MRIAAPLSALVCLLTSATALAAPDLAVTFSAPAATVYTTARYRVTVRNNGNHNASGVTLAVDLPETHTSPQVYILGTLGARDARCALSGRDLSCNLGTLQKRKQTTVWFDMALPYSAEPIVFGATAATTSSEPNLANNSAAATANLSYVATPVAAPVPAHNRHCTGTGLISFFECELFPGSLMSHDIVLQPGGTLTFVGAGPEYSGTWSQPGGSSTLTLTYFELGSPVASFSGVGVGGSCFEGQTVFFPDNGYVSMYEVCLQ